MSGSNHKRSVDEENNIPAPATASPPREERGLRYEYPVFVGEFVGTFLFLFLAFAGTQIAAVTATPSSPSQEVSKLLYISLAFGIGLAVNVSIFASISGAMFNPAVSPPPPHR